jgi:hypothetical protein
MKKALLTFTVIIILVGLLTSSAKAATLIDDFNDGNADGWVSYPSLKEPWVYGNWRVENGVLVQDTGYDGVIALLENFTISDQTVETKLKLNGPSGGGGITFWFQNDNNGVFVSVSNGQIEAAEVVDGVWYTTYYPFNFNINENRWVTLKVDANSVSGELNIYADGVYFTTYNVKTQNRSGRTGVINGNAGGYFDDFKLYSNDVPPTIDIKPGDANNTINLKGMKDISVAMLSSINFSAPAQIDRTSFTFGKTGDENSLLSCSKRLKDFNGDGLLDLVCTFNLKSTGFQCGDIEGVLKGKFSFTGISFMDKQKVMIEPCR